MVFAVGLTGTIASGKTTAAKIFAEFGADVFSADTIAKQLVTKNTPSYHHIVAHFGSTILQDNEEIDRKRLRALIFKTPHERFWLESLLHPLIRIELELAVNSSTAPYCIVEIPLLITKEKYPYLNKVLLITAPQKKQIHRIVARDNCSETDALTILAAQPDIKIRMNYADDIINNKGDLIQLKKVLYELHLKYLIKIK